MHGLHRILGAQHHHEVADHGRLALVIELDDVCSDNARSAMSTIVTAAVTIFWRAQMMARLLTPQHHAGDFRRVGQVG